MDYPILSGVDARLQPSQTKLTNKGAYINGRTFCEYWEVLMTSSSVVLTHIQRLGAP